MVLSGGLPVWPCALSGVINRRAIALVLPDGRGLPDNPSRHGGGRGTPWAARPPSDPSVLPVRVVRVGLASSPKWNLFNRILLPREQLPPSPTRTSPAWGARG